MQLRSDVGVGSFLSGGLDSSMVSLLASKYSSKRLKTFTLTYKDYFKGKKIDQFYAKKISKLISSDHHELAIDKNKILKNIEKALNSFDQPFAGVISTFFLSQEVSKYTKVVLSGDGADELFGSYLFPRVMYPIHLIRNNTYEEFKKKINKNFEFRNKIKLIKELKNKKLLEIKNYLKTFNEKEKKVLLNKKLLKEYRNPNNSKNLTFDSGDLVNNALSSIKSRG